MRHPVCIAHGARVQDEVRLPKRTPEGTVYVPAGPCLSGGRGARYHRRHKRTLEGFFISETEAFLNSLIDAKIRLVHDDEVDVIESDVVAF